MNGLFTSNYYKVLEIMYDRLVVIKDEVYCPLKQAEIADMLGLSRNMINKIFCELSELGYIKKEAKSRWTLSGEAMKMVRIAKEI